MNLTNKTFGEGFALTDKENFKLVPLFGDITQLATYQESLINLMQGFTLYSNPMVEKDIQYEGWVTDKPEPIYFGLEMLKSMLLNSGQLNELQEYRIKTKRKKEKKQDKNIKKMTKQMEKKIKNSKEEISNLMNKHKMYVDLLEKEKTKEELNMIHKKAYGNQKDE